MTRLRSRIRAARLAEEAGMALVVAVMVSGLMLMAGLAILSFTDNQTRMTGQERLRESTLNLAEGALNAQANLLTSAWPETADKAFVPCTQASTSVKCPEAQGLISGFKSKDFGNGAPIAWHLSVRDNGLGGFYDDAATATQPAWDQSGPAGGGPDGIMWLRAQATIRGEKRTVVSLIRATPVAHAFPRGVLTAAHFHTTNNGNKVIIDTGGGPGVMARCNPGAGGPSRGNSCLDYQVDKGQVWPNSWTADPALPNAMTTNEVNALRNRAKAANQWYSSCPSSLPNAQLVFIESGPCSYSSGVQVNSMANPGMVVVNKGTLTLAGTLTFYGLIYMPNADNMSGNVVMLGGDAQVIGAIVVDGNGGISAGSSKVNVQYDANVFNLVTTTQTINVIANSWRELNGH
jgi:hypothetical protein